MAAALLEWTILVGVGSLAAAGTWPAGLQPFFLSALPNELTHQDAAGIGKFPLAIINHKQAKDDEPLSGQAEAKQLRAIAAIKKSNASCQTHFYLNSQIMFPELALHETFAAHDSWWLRQDSGEYVWHNETAHSAGAHMMDLTVPEARQAWLRAALAAASHEYVDGIFVDKAKDHGINLKGVSEKRMVEWRAAHAQLLAELRSSTDKSVILNNNHGLASGDSIGMGQLFERWGQSPDHDGLSLQEDIKLYQKLTSQGIIGLARAGGVEPGSATKPDPVACGAGLAAFLVALGGPDAGFFTCAVDFRPDGWVNLLQDPLYARPLGAPNGPATVHQSGLLRRRFTSGTVAWLNVTAPLLGCVRWSGGEVSGVCPPEVPSQTTLSLV